MALIKKGAVCIVKKEREAVYLQIGDKVIVEKVDPDGAGRPESLPYRVMRVYDGHTQWVGRGQLKTIKQ